MAFRLQFEFEASCTSLDPCDLPFRFRGRDFRLLAGDVTKQDCLVSLVDPGTEVEINNARRDAMIFCACLSWDFLALVNPTFAGGLGISHISSIHDEVMRRDINRSDRKWPPTRPYLGLPSLPSLETAFQETSLGLFREGLASRSPFYRFLCYWNILNIPPRPDHDVAQWIKGLPNRVPTPFTTEKMGTIQQLQQSYGSLSHYLDEECRDAVAHVIRNNPARTSIDPNSFVDGVRIAEASDILFDVIHIYLKEELGLVEKSHPFQLPGASHPEYMTEAVYRVRKQAARRTTFAESDSGNPGTAIDF